MSVIESTVDGRYQILSRVASGGMGEVYVARDEVLGRDVAVKVLHPQLAGDRGFVDRFRSEARAAAMLNHPNIVGVYDWGSANGTYFMVMEFVRGPNLRALLHRYGRLQPAQVADVCIQALSALEHAHGHGIVHRDVKPENILIAQDGTVKVADFGLARAFADATVSHAQGMVTGTVQYLAPEQIEGQPADPRADLYALGVVMFELLTGQPPFSGETSVAVAYAHLSDRVPRPSSRIPTVPSDFDSIVVWATEKDRSARPRSARAMREAMERVRGASPPAPAVVELAAHVPAGDSSPEEHSARPRGLESPLRQRPTIAPGRASPSRRRRRRARTVITAAVSVFALAVAAWATWVYAVPHYTSVPAVTGLSLRVASARLDEAGLRPRIGKARFSTSVDAGRVVHSEPPEGTRMREGTMVLLIPSKGLPVRPVPYVVRDTSSVAEAALSRAGFKVEVEKTFDDDVPVDRVVSQDPDAGLELTEGSVVTIVVSKGPPPVVVPSVIGQQVGPAVDALERAGLVVEQTAEHSLSVREGDVIGTQPSAGIRIPKGSTVTVVVSLGPRTFALPDVVGVSSDDAEQRLDGLGLDVKRVALPGTTGAVVVFQDPAAGTTVQEGQQVTVVVGD